MADNAFKELRPEHHATIFLREINRFVCSRTSFLILQTNDDNAKVRKLSGNIYVRIWLVLDSLVDAEIILTADEKKL